MGRNQCLLCHNSLPMKGFVHAALTEMNHGFPYKSGYICQKCQEKFNIKPTTELGEKLNASI